MLVISNGCKSKSQQPQDELRNSLLFPCTDGYFMEDILAFEKNRHSQIVEVDAILLGSYLDLEDPLIDTASWPKYTTELNPTSLPNDKHLAFVVVDSVTHLLSITCYFFSPIYLDSTDYVLGLTYIDEKITYNWPQLEQKCSLQKSNIQNCSEESILGVYSDFIKYLSCNYKKSITKTNLNDNETFNSIDSMSTAVKNEKDFGFECEYLCGKDIPNMKNEGVLSFDYFGTHQLYRPRKLDNCSLIISYQKGVLEGNSITAGEAGNYLGDEVLTSEKAFIRSVLKSRNNSSEFLHKVSIH